MRRISFEKYRGQNGRSLILAAAMILILLFTTSLSNPGAMSADQQHESGELNQNVEPPRSEGVDSANPSQQATVQCGVLKVAQPTEGIKQIPLYCISGKFHGEYVPSNLPYRDMPVLEGISLPISEISRWGAYLLNGGSNHGYLMLAPRDWKVISAEIGMNGSVKVEMQDPANPGIHMSYLDAGTCMGCATRMIGSYFPEMKKWVNDQGSVSEPLVFESRTELNKHMVQFTLKKNTEAFKTYGAAYWLLDQDNAQFTMLEVEAPEAQAQIVQTMLDFYTKYPAAFVY
ncbi:DUF4850 domain-containing protein [Paenibacillus sp.]|jgi:hypothetical protein|uniref:DUF4850 domain-containing protein n=1 Tax=Paenibacillus sp. TaxID=58172 RepID=UPI00283150FD|nr:DUF4850 domain-containing protein [Paenibacillus sp.]MDR0271439.1 DUF4850 domain-containing protein [Paenibacillus sp.]